MQQFDAFGHLINRITADQADSHKKLSAIDHRLKAVEAQIETLTTWAKRGALLVLLWAGAVGINLTTEQKAEAISLVLKSLAR